MPAHHRAAHKAPPEQAGLGKEGEGVAEGVWATWKVISLGVAMFSVGFSLCNVILLFRKERQDRNNKASHADKKRKERNNF